MKTKIDLLDQCRSQIAELRRVMADDEEDNTVRPKLVEIKRLLSNVDRELQRVSCEDAESKAVAQFEIFKKQSNQIQQHFPQTAALLTDLNSNLQLITSSFTRSADVQTQLGSSTSKQTQIEVPADYIDCLKESLKLAQSSGALTPEQQLDKYIFIENLTKHLTAVNENRESILEGKTLLTKRWMELLRVTALAYTHSPHYAVTKACMCLASYIGKNLNINPFLVLMPTLKNEETISGESLDKENLQSHHFIVSESGTEVIFVSDCLEDADDSGVLYAQHLSDGQSRELTQFEKMRIIEHSQESERYYKAIQNRNAVFRDKSTIFGSLMKLSEALLEGSIKGQGEGKGEELNAGGTGNEGVVEFKQYLDTVPTSTRNNIFGLTATGLTDAFGILWERITDPVGVEKRAGRNYDPERLSARYCFKILSDNFLKMIDENQPRIREWDRKHEAIREAADLEFVTAKSLFQQKYNSSEYSVGVSNGVGSNKLLQLGLYEQARTISTEIWRDPESIEMLSVYLEGMILSYLENVKDQGYLGFDAAIKNTLRSLSDVALYAVWDVLTGDTKFVLSMLTDIIYPPFVAKKINKYKADLQSNVENYPQHKFAKLLLYYYMEKDQQSLLTLVPHVKEEVLNDLLKVTINTSTGSISLAQEFKKIKSVDENVTQEHKPLKEEPLEEKPLKEKFDSESTLLSISILNANDLFIFVRNTSASAINYYLSHPTSTNINLLMLVVKTKNNSMLNALLAKASTAAIDSAIIHKDRYSATPLHWAADWLDSQAFQALIAKASTDAINAALVIQNYSHVTPLHYAAVMQDSQAFQVLIAKASPDAINTALVIQNNVGVTPIHYAAEKQDSHAFQAVIEKASTDAINTALVIQNNVGVTPLHYAAARQDSQAFQALIEKASTDAINAALVIQDNSGCTPLYCSALKQDSQAFQALIAKASADAIKAALVIKNMGGYTPLYCASWRQDSQAFQALIDKASPQAIMNCNAWSLLKSCSSQRSLPFLAVALFKVIRSGESPEKLKIYKKELKDYILSQTDLAQKRQLLNEAIDPATQLGKFFLLARGFFNVNISKGTVGELKKALDALGPADSQPRPPSPRSRGPS